MNTYEMRCREVFEDVQNQKMGCPFASALIRTPDNMLCINTDVDDETLESNLGNKLELFMRNAEQKMLAILPPENIAEYKAGEDFAWRVFMLMSYACNEINQKQLEYHAQHPQTLSAATLEKIESVQEENQTRAQLEALFAQPESRNFICHFTMNERAFSTQMLLLNPPQENPEIGCYDAIIPFVHGTYYPQNHQRHAPRQTVFVVNKTSDIHYASSKMKKINRQTKEWARADYRRALHVPLPDMDQDTGAGILYHGMRWELVGQGKCKPISSGFMTDCMASQFLGTEE